MAGCAAVSFNNVPASVFNCLVQKAAEQGITISSDSGTASKSGFKVSWNYNRAGSSLTIQCLDKPFIVPCSLVKSTIKSTVQDCGGS
jgi:hypothetical protein